MSLSQHKEIAKFPLKINTLFFFIKEDKILLALKRRGFGAGRWNGVENPKEEISVTPKKTIQVATLDFYYENKLEWDRSVIVYFVTDWENVPTSSEDVIPAWYDRNKIPFDLMWPDEKIWLPKVLEGEVIHGEFLFDDKQKLKEHQIVVI